MSATAKLFMHGRSQAVRLPKEFRMLEKEMRVSRVGDRIVLEPMDVKFELDVLGAAGFLLAPIPEYPPLQSDDSIIFD